MTGAEISTRKRRTGSRLPSLLVFAVIAAALLGAMYLIFGTVEFERREREQVRRNSDAIAELSNINRAVLNAETGQRGYLITLDRRYLQPYLVGRDQYGPAIARLRALPGSDRDPAKDALLDRIQNLADAKFAEMTDSVGLVEQGNRVEAQRRVLTDEGQEVMERLRAALHDLEAAERRDLGAATADSARAEARLLPLLSGLMLLLVIAMVLNYGLVTRAARAEAEAAQAANVAEARDRADLLARELNHRVKNLFSVILAIVRMSGKDVPEAKPVIDRIADRIRALLTAHEVTQGTPSAPVASLRTLVETTLAPYRSDRLRAELDGPEIVLSAKQVTPIGLVLHELTTNAVKYGCWAHGGMLHVTWRREGEEVVIDWRETGVPPTSDPGDRPARQGFGSLLMTSAGRQLRGAIDREFTSQGALVTIRLPAERPPPPP
ncbi:MAG: sensor histidine kinase [Tsuneonella sp.]